LPFNESEVIEEETLKALAALGVTDGRVDPALIESLRDSAPARRSAAAYVLARAGAANREAVRGLLVDPDPRVRLRSARGLAAVQDRSAVPVLIDLLGEGPLPVAWQAEELLYRIAGDKAPAAS